MTLMVTPADTVESLWEKVEAKTGIPPSQQRLLYEGKQLASDGILADYRIQKESTLHLGNPTAIYALNPFSYFEPVDSSSFAWRSGLCLMNVLVVQPIPVVNPCSGVLIARRLDVSCPSMLVVV